MYHLVISHMENPLETEVEQAGKIMDFYGPYSIAMFNYQRVHLLLGQMA